MCRMLAIMSKRRISSSFLHDFRLLAEKGDVLPIAKEPGHKDGWGIVGYQKHTPILLGRQPTNAMKDPKYEEACEHLDQLGLTGSLMTHLRKASKGKRSQENTAPFIRGEWCFGHNGTIRNFSISIKGLKGDTDSERFFLLLLKGIVGNSTSTELAIERTVREIRHSYEYSSLTFLLSNGTHVYAYREYSDPRDSWYYNLMYAIDKDMVLISQQKIWYRDWVTIPNRNLITVMKNLKVYIKNI
ncbi:class II glutamine amidotransferase [Candidatus Bathyarchaeota archaeon]|nr:class II glutamine amidotransferase [Candidatus Bathyarchaeota archaeon]